MTILDRLLAVPGTYWGSGDGPHSGPFIARVTVKAVNAVGTSNPSNEASATPQATVPGQPTNLAASAGDTKVMLGVRRNQDTANATVGPVGVGRIVGNL